MDINGEANLVSEIIGESVDPQIETRKVVPADPRGILKDPATGRFIKGHCGRPKGALSKATIAKQMILDASPQLVKQAIQLAQGNASMMSTLLGIALPANRSQLEPTAIPGIQDCHDLESRTACIMSAVTGGIISSDVGLQMVAGLRQAEEAQRLRQLTDEITDLKSRVIDGRGLVKRIN